MQSNIKHGIFSFLKFIKDLIIIAGIGVIIGGFYEGYQIICKNKQQLQTVQATVTQLGTGISIDNQRKAKIEKATTMIMDRNKNLKYEIASNYAEYFVDESDKYNNVDFVLLISIASQESAFKDSALSSTGAIGIMQMIPTTAMDMCEYLRMSYSDKMLYNPKYNIRLAARYVNELMTAFGNNIYTIAAYNSGARGGSRYKLYLAGQLSKDYISKETLDYVPKVVSFYKKYSNMLK